MAKVKRSNFASNFTCTFATFPKGKKKRISFALLLVSYFYFSHNLGYLQKQKNASILFDDLTTKKVDLHINFEKLEPQYKYDLEAVTCHDSFLSHVNTTVLLYDNGMIDWICSTHKASSSEEVKVAKTMMILFQLYNDKYKPRSLMLDIGANTGYYSLLAAKMGHKAIQFDLQPECQRVLRTSVLRNGFKNQIVTIGAGISDVEGTIEVPSVGCDGQFPVKVRAKDAPKTRVPLYPLEEFVNIGGDDIMMMKIDTEGNEKRVLSGAKQFFKNKKVKNAIVEVTPCCEFWKNAGITPIEVQEIIGEIVSYGYVMVSLWDYKIFHTVEEAKAYVNEAPFDQSDMLFTLEDNVDSIVKAIQ